MKRIKVQRKTIDSGNVDCTLYYIQRFSERVPIIMCAKMKRK